MRLGVLALGRPTFDVPYADARRAAALAALAEAGMTVMGGDRLLLDVEAARSARAEVMAGMPEMLLLLQTTFTDAAMAVEIAAADDRPLHLWGFPEPRTGGRLRLNAFCGLNLAAHALGRAGREARFLYAAPEADTMPARLSRWLTGKDMITAPAPLPLPAPTAEDEARAAGALAALRGQRLGLVGEHPAGFDTCRFEPSVLDAVFGLAVERVALGDLFMAARAIPPDRVAEGRAKVAHLAGLDTVDQAQLDRSLALHASLDDLGKGRQLCALAVRCWPETFTDYGCAVCGPMGLLAEAGTPTACEADVLGAVTALLLQGLAREPAWLVDIVDMDEADGTAVLWHCGSAPPAMRDPEAPAEAQIHTNRRMPLLLQFPLRPGRVTVARLSQARNGLALVVTGGTMLRRPMSFTGTSGVIRFDAPLAAARDALLGEALEHHVAIAYGDHRAALVAIGRKLGVPVRGLGH